MYSSTALVRTVSVIRGQHIAVDRSVMQELRYRVLLQYLLTAEGWREPETAFHVVPNALVVVQT
jgi:hypothetical protein